MIGYGELTMNESKQIGITAKEMAEALEHIMKLLPPPGEKEILMIKNNPSLSKFQKFRLIKIIIGNERKTGG